MAIPAGCWRIVYRGNLPGGEVWQTGFWLNGGAPTSNGAAIAAAQVEFDALDDATSGPYNVWKTLVNANVSIAQVAVYSYVTGGTHADFVGLSSGTPKAGTATGAQLPNQIGVVLSLLTNQSGRSFRGRMYWPISLGVQAATGQWTVANLQPFVTRMAKHFQDFDNAAGEGNVVVVSSKLTAATDVTGLRMDTRPDVQRRRANKQVVTGQATAVVNP